MTAGDDDAQITRAKHNARRLAHTSIFSDCSPAFVASYRPHKPLYAEWRLALFEEAQAPHGLLTSMLANNAIVMGKGHAFDRHAFVRRRPDFLERNSFRPASCRVAASADEAAGSVGRR